MENENIMITPSYVGPLAAAEDSADKFVSGMIYCGLLEKLLEQQQIVNEILARTERSSNHSEAIATNEDLEKVWFGLGRTLGIEC